MQRREQSLPSDACALLSSYTKEIESIQISFNRLKEMTVNIEKFVLQQTSNPASNVGTQCQYSKALFSEREKKHNDMLQFEEDECSTSGLTTMTASEFSLRPCGKILYGNTENDDNDDNDDDNDDDITESTHCNKAEFYSPLLSPRLDHVPFQRNPGHHESAMFSYADLYNVDSFNSHRLRMGSAENGSCSKRVIAESPKRVKRYRGDSAIKRRLAKAKKRIARVLSKLTK